MPIFGEVKVWPRHAYVRVSGELRNATTNAPVEQWSFGIRVGELGGQRLAQDTAVPIDPAVNQATLATYLTAKVVPAVRGLFADTRFSPWCAVTKISCNMLVDGGGDNPVYEYGTSTEVLPGVTAGVAAIKGLGPTGSQLALHHPPQIALAASLRTAVSRGNAARGRIYLPGIATQLDVNWCMASGDTSVIAGKVAGLISGMQSGPTTDAHLLWPCIVSPVGIGTGTLRPIVSVDVGNVMDTVVRRHRALVETRATATPALA